MPEVGLEPLQPREEHVRIGEERHDEVAGRREAVEVTRLHRDALVEQLEAELGLVADRIDLEDRPAAARAPLQGPRRLPE